MPIDFVSDYEDLTGESVEAATARLEAAAESRAVTKVIAAPKPAKVAPVTVAETA